ncbi:hypothetical protein ACLOJK_040441 [Asimina triloba]
MLDRAVEIGFWILAIGSCSWWVVDIAGVAHRLPSLRVAAPVGSRHATAIRSSLADLQVVVAASRGRRREEEDPFAHCRPTPRHRKLACERRPLPFAHGRRSDAACWIVADAVRI